MRKGSFRRPRSLPLGRSDTALLDLVDHVLNKGLVVTGDVVLGLAGIDLVYLRLSALLCAADRVLADAARARRPRGLLPVRRPR